MNEQDWVDRILTIAGASLEDLETAKLLVGKDTIAAEIAEGEAVQRLVQLEALQIRRAAGGEDYEIAKLGKGPGFKNWPVQND
ncbi:MAG: hypothetical protein PGN27_25115 [Mycolicibacterium neoaurum]|uniref:hypothetical protein n=1 Tax=Mycolicibacterium neoaurum TaxID=1795 RepID=UPI002FF7724D